MTHSGPEHHGRPEQHGHLEQLLAAWLPAQRWFAGSGTTIDDVVISSDVQLTAGDPELRHLIADVRAGTELGRYQLLVALAAQSPAALADRVIGALPDGRTAYDGAFDPELCVVLLGGIASQRRVGQLRFVTEPGAVIDSGSAARTLPALASNTSVVYGDRAILKLIRRPASGCHPDLEVPSALARGGSKLVAAPLGWIELAGDEPTVLAIMSEYFRRALRARAG